MITLRKLSLQRGSKLLLEDADLTVYPGYKVGIVGPNGSGKSTLFSLLRGELHADGGDLDLPPKLSIAHVAQETPASPVTALEYALAGDTELTEVITGLAQARQAHDGMREAELHAHYDAIGGYTARARAGQLLHGLGFAPGEEEQPVSAFSGGWRMRLNLAQALMRRADLLLLDEPTNHLDLDAVMWFEQYLKSYPGTLLLISHDREFLDNVVGHVAHLDQRKFTLYTGNYSGFERQRAEQLAQQQALYVRQQRERAHIQSFVDRFRAQATKARQAQSRLKALARMELIAAAQVDSPFHFGFKPPLSCPNPLLDLDEADAGYADKPILRQIKLRLLPGSRIGLLGPNGAGKSTLIKLLAGVLPPLAGKLQAAPGLQIGYFAQHQLEQLDPAASPLLHAQRLDPRATEQDLRDFLGGFGFRNDMATAAVAPFSGGEKARLALALLVRQRPNLLLLDEPTNHLDLAMREALTLALQDYQGALVVVSHDRHLLRATCDDFLLVAKGQVTGFEGDLEDYRQWLMRERAAQQNLTPASNSAAGRREQRQQGAAQRAQRRQLENRSKKLEQQIAKLGEAKTQIETLLADPAIYADRAKVQEYTRQRADLSDQLSQVEDEWLSVQEALETE